MDQNVSVSFSIPSSPALDPIMEQAAWSGAGIVTRLDLVKEISRIVSNEDDDNDIDCGMDGSSYSSALYIYLFDQSMNYEVDVTHGALSELIIQTVEVREAVQFSLTLEESIKYPVSTLLSYEWGDDTYESDGAVSTVKPTISISGQQVTASKRVYGSVIVKYTTIRHTRGLVVPPREGESSNIYDSYAWLRYDGGNDLKKLDPPEGAEEDYLNDNNCIFGKNLNVTGGGGYPDAPPTVDGTNKDIDIDYCTQKPEDELLGNE